MPKIKPFEKYTKRYENWFKKHKYVYRSQLKAIRNILPTVENGLEIGVGTARFAAPLGFRVGIDPSQEMLKFARDKIDYVVLGVAESLPFRNDIFDTILIVTTICFVDDVSKTLKEAKKALKYEGNLIIGFIDKESPLGNDYQENKKNNPFYRDAVFLSTKELINDLKKSGFTELKFVQTIFHKLNKINKIEKVQSGYGKGSFVAISVKPLK